MKSEYSSLTKFELTRILVPGFYFAVLVSMFIRIFISPLLVGDPTPGRVLLMFLLVTLVSGLTLYAKETPKRRRAFVENQPSAHLLQLSRSLAKVEPLTEDDARHLYFYILNNVMPGAIQEKIFLFGTIYYVMIQIRRTSFWFGIVALAGTIAFLSFQQPSAPELSAPLLFTALVWVVYGLNVRYNKADRKMQENYRDQIFWLDLHRDIVADLLKKRSHSSAK
jgi:hypothetical protein